MTDKKRKPVKSPRNKSGDFTKKVPRRKSRFPVGDSIGNEDTTNSTGPRKPAK